MASHKQSFQCFDTVTDDPPVKPPPPHGHSSTASFRGSSGSTRLEPLEDRGCHLCTDHQQAKVIASEASGAYSNPWYHLQTHPQSQQYTSRRHTQPEDVLEDHHHHHHRHSKKIVLVKNSDPSFRRTIVLHRRSLRSLALFMDEVSELMQCLIRKLYTLEGHKIDSVQCLLHCPSILVCVGREPFHPLLLDSFRKNSYDKLPKLNPKSRANMCTEEKGAKKNVNFGLETKRSVIHPRCDSTNKSGRMSSSEKLFPNGLNSSPPGHRGDCPHAGENMMDDDIEKRVLVNKDGSMSMEMKVRFRLLHNETLHWSTEVKKSKRNFNESHIVPDDACSLSLGSAESCSEVDSLSAGEADETYNTKRYQKHFEEPHCQHCCARCQEYHMWKNPIPPDQGPVRRIRSSSSSASSRRIVCKKASIDSMHTMSSEEYTEHVVEKATCIQQTFGPQGDTTIEQCTINHCCGRTDVCSVSSKTKSTTTAHDKCASDCDESKPDVISSNLLKDQLSLQITQPVLEDERPVSVVSSSSQILASLKEDQVDEEAKTSLSISRTSHGQQEDEMSRDAEPSPCAATPCKSPASLVHLSPRPPSKASSSGKSKKARKVACPEVGHEEVRSEDPSLHNASSGPKTCTCVATKDIATPETSESNDQQEDIKPKTDVQETETEERTLSAMSAKSKISTTSLSELSYENGKIPEYNGETIEERASSAISIQSNISGKSGKINQEERTHNALSVNSQRTDKSKISDNVKARTSSALSVKSNSSVRSVVSDHCVHYNSSSVKSVKSNSGIEELANVQTEERAPSSFSASSKMSVDLSELEEDEQDRPPSSISMKSNISNKSKSDISEAVSFQEAGEPLNSINTLVKLNTPEAEAAAQEELPEERSPSSVSSVSNISTRSKTSKISDVDQENCSTQERASSSISLKSTTSAKSKKSKTMPTPESEEELKARVPSVLSIKSNKSEIEEERENRAPSALSIKSETSGKTSNPPGMEQLDERASSALSTKSNCSVRSKGSKMSEVAENYDQSSKVCAEIHITESSDECRTAPKSREKHLDIEERAPSALSAKSKSSAKSNKSKVSDMAAEDDLRSASAMSSKSNISAKSVKSIVSENVAEKQVQTKDQTKEQAQRALLAQSNKSRELESDRDEVAEERALSAMSFKSNASKTSKKSSNLKVPTALPRGTEHQTEERTQSALSTSSQKSGISDVLTDELEANSQEEERASSALSTKSNVSTKSKKSNASNDMGKEDRVLSAMSARSDLSSKNSISAKSKGSHISEAQQEKSDDEESEVKAPSVSKSSISMKSTKSKEEEQVQNLDRPSSAISVISEATPDENEIPNDIQERAQSAVSAISKSSLRSRTSKVSEIIIDEPEEQKSKRATSSGSLKSGVSGKSSPVDSVNEDKPKEARTESAFSSISNASARSSKSEYSELSTASAAYKSERSAMSCASEKSKNSHVTSDVNEEANKVVERTTSSLSVKSTPSTTSDFSGKSSIVPTKSNASAKSVLSEVKEPKLRSTSVMCDEVSKTDIDNKSNRSPSKLSVKSNVSIRSKKSKASGADDHITSNIVDMELNRDESPVSNHSKVSQGNSSNKCVCGAINIKPSSPIAFSEKDSEMEEEPGSPLSKKSTKSKVSSVGSASERILTPTSTSVSIGIVEDQADDVEELNGGVVSINSRASTSSKIEICGKANQYLSESPVQINKTTQTTEERPKSLASAKSNASGKSRSKCSHCNSTCPTETNQDKEDVASNKSTKSTGISGHTEITGQEKNEITDVTHTSQSACSKCSSSQDKRPNSLVSSASAISEKSKTKEHNDRPKSNVSNSSSCLKVNSQENIVEAAAHKGRSSKLSNKSLIGEDKTPRCHSATFSLTSGNQLSPVPPNSPKISKKPVFLHGGSNESVLSQTVPVPDSKEKHFKAAGEHTPSCCYATIVTDIKSEKGSKCRKRIESDSSCHKTDDDMSGLSPSFLPNASPTEVVNEWLRKIPSDTTLCDLGDEFQDNLDSIKPHCTSHVPLGNENEHGNLKTNDLTKHGKQNEIQDENAVNAESATDKKPAEAAEVAQSRRENEPKMFDSSVLVMKVLLSPKLDRCNSLPEVSPVYGRKLSTSAQGLLDCLANLQLLDFGPSDEDDKKEKYQELMRMLKSLWLCDPKTSEERNKHLDKEFKARSSSGVDVNSGSTGSGKISVNDGTQAQNNTECDGLDTLTKVMEVDETVEEEASETTESKNDSATPDIATKSHWITETNKNFEEKLRDNVPSSDETIRNNDSPREPIETPFSSNKSSQNNHKTESDHQEDTSSGSPTHQKGQLSKKLSQDPDPVWVLNLLSKLEKQFMTHYVDAMSEFKVRWNLDDNEQLDTMICELQDEVRRRIQLSIDRELNKIQGRSGRPRPPKETISRESTVQTEQRRRRLKVMRNQSVDQKIKSDDNYTMTGTDFSDQRSDDEYCPCDTCLKKKMASKNVLPAEMLNSAPVMMDFDLRRILQMKKPSPIHENIKEIASECTTEGENVGLEAVKEEYEKEIHAFSAQEIKEECEKHKGEEEDDASSTCVEDSSEKQSNISTQVEKDVNEDEEVADFPENMPVQKRAVEQDEEQEENETKINYEVDENVTKEEATEKHTEDETEMLDETAGDETTEEKQIVEQVENTSERTIDNKQTAKSLAAADDEIVVMEENANVSNDDAEEKREGGESKTEEDGQADISGTPEKSNDETMEDGEATEHETREESEMVKSTSGECEIVTDGQTSEGETVNNSTAEEHEVDEKETKEEQSAEDETAADGESVNVDTVEEHVVTVYKTEEDEDSAEDEVGKESETVHDDTAEEHEVTENETAEDEQTAEDEAGHERETVDDTAEEHEVTENERAEDEQAAEEEAGEECETVSRDTAEEHEVTENETAEEQTAEDETGEERKTVEDHIVEEHEVTENEMAEDEKSAEDATGESETVNDDTVEEHEVTENETAEDEQTVEDETGKEGETVEDNTAEEHVVTDNETAEGEQSAKCEAGEECEMVDDDTAEEHEVTENEMAEHEQDADGKTGEECETVDDDTAEEHEVTENETAEDEQDADGKAGEECETVDDDTAEDHEVTENETAEDEQAADCKAGEECETVDDDTAEEHEVTENETAEDEQSADGKAGEECETVNDDTAEEHEVTENEVAEDEQAADGKAGEECETVDDDTAEEHEVTENETAEDEQAADCKAGEECETVDDDTAEEHEVTENETAGDDQTAEDEAGEECEIVDDDTAEEHEVTENETAEDEQDADGKAGEERETVDDDTAEEHEVNENETAGDDQTAEDEDGEECEIVDDDTAEEHEMTENEKAGEEQTTEGEAGEEVETFNDDTAEEHEMTENETAGDEQTAEGEAGEECETVDDDTAEEHEVTENETAEDEHTAEGKTGEEVETFNDDTAEEHEVTDNETAEDEIGEEVETINDDTAENHEGTENETAKNDPGEEDETVNDDTSEEHEGTENKTTEDGQTAEGETGEESETGHDDTAEEHEVTENEMAEDEQTAEGEAGEEGETGNDDTAEDHEMTENETAGDGQEESETVDSKTSEVGVKKAQNVSVENDGVYKIMEDDTLEEGEASSKNYSAEDGEKETDDDEKVEIANDDTAKSVESGQTAKAKTSEESEKGDSANESETAEDETSENGHTAKETETDCEEEEANEKNTGDDEPVEDNQTGEAEPAEESETTEDEERDTTEEASVEERETDEKQVDEAGDNTITGGVPAEEKETSEAETTDDGSTEADPEMSEEKEAVEVDSKSKNKNANVELADQKQIPVHEAAGDEKDRSQSNVEENSCESATEEPSKLKSCDALTNVVVIEDETQLKNNGDVVLDSVDDKDEESGKQYKGTMITVNKGGLVANNGESAEAGDEAEDDTEPDMDTDEGEHNKNISTSVTFPPKQQQDEKPDEASSFDVVTNHNSESEDGVDADGEDSETEEHNKVIDLSSESDSKSQRKTAHKTFKTLESSCVEKDEVKEMNTKDKGKLSDITEDTAEGEENQTTENLDDSENIEWESSENALQKQMTKSSVESQPGSFEEVHEEQAKNLNVSNNQKAK